jgi:hypothetical protein
LAVGSNLHLFAETRAKSQGIFGQLLMTNLARGRKQELTDLAQPEQLLKVWSA